MNTTRTETGSLRCKACGKELKEYEYVLCSDCEKEADKVYEDET
jgi:hypothetical protein